MPAVGSSLRALLIVSAGLVATHPEAAEAATRIVIGYAPKAGTASASRPPGPVSYLYIDGDSGANQIVLDWNDSRDSFLARDARAKVLSDQCERVSRHAMRCPYSDEDNFAVLGYQGDDRIEVGAVPAAADGPEILGGAGRDLLVGGAHRDYLCGDLGNDELRGRPGNDFLSDESCNFVAPKYRGRDVLYGGAGNDRLDDYYGRGPDSSFGGRGDDRIYQADHDPEVVTAAGPGSDRCRLDRRSDPVPHGCETIRYGRRAPFAHRPPPD